MPGGGGDIAAGLLESLVNGLQFDVREAPAIATGAGTPNAARILDPAWRNRSGHGWALEIFPLVRDLAIGPSDLFTGPGVDDHPGKACRVGRQGAQAQKQAVRRARGNLTDRRGIGSQSINQSPQGKIE